MCTPVRTRNPDPPGPSVRSQRALTGDGRRTGSGKRDEERIVLGVDLDTAVLGPRVRQQPVVIAKNLLNSRGEHALASRIGTEAAAADAYSAVT